MTEHTHPALDAFAARLDFPLDAFQRSACERLEQGRSVLVAAPTGSGKTTVAEFAVHLARRERDTRIFYTTPIKALSNQKFHELCAEYGEDEVGLLTGDVNLRGNAPIVVMTTEVLRNMIYAEPADTADSAEPAEFRGYGRDALAGLDFVVLDEVHYLGDRWRGAVWEEIILHLPAGIRLVSLSATVSNVEEFGDWMHTVRGDTDVIVSEHRPVPLYQHVLTSKQLMPLYVDSDGELAVRGKLNPEVARLDRSASGSDDRGRRGSYSGGRGGHGGRRRRGPHPAARRHSRISRSDVARALDETGLLPGIVFIFSRNGCDQAVRQCLYEGVRLTTSAERTLIRDTVEAAIGEMDEDDLRVLGVSEWIAGLERGIAAHHAGLLPQFKTVVEQLFQHRLVKLVFATETLALGINMPAKSVVIERLDKFNGEERVPLTSGEYTQLTGRAGRRGIDTEGHAIVIWGASADVESIVHLASTRSFPVISSFRPTPNMAVNLLQRMSLSHARDTLELSLAQFQADRAVVDQARELQELRVSLEGYERASARAKGADRRRWEERTRKLRRQVERGRRRIEARSSGIARTFERVVDLLTEFDYLGRNDAVVLPYGLVLSRIYGERDLLIAECVRRDAWRGIDAAGLAALCCALTYEPRRDDEPDARWPGGPFRVAFDRTLEVWLEIDDARQRHRLPEAPEPHAGLARVMQGWASGWSLERTLDEGGIGAGDFVRWAKQTIDLLDQLSDAMELAPIDEQRFVEFRKVARRAKSLVRRGIVETASQA